MEKIGVLTLLYNNYNYGGVLQAYALIHYLCENKYDAKGILYCGSNNVVYPTTKDKLSQYSKSEVIKKVFHQVQGIISNKKNIKIIEKRKNLFLEFEKKFIPTTLVYSDRNINKLNNKFDYFISGSDQVWNPNCAFLPFLQGFVTDNSKKISYAASISRSKLSEHEKEVMIPYINKFQCISVREKTAKKLLDECGINDVNVVLDPTFLLSKEQWQSIIPTQDKKEKYVLCYFFSNSKRYRKFINKFCKKRGYKLLYIPYAKQQYIYSDSRGEGKPIYDIGPLEFLSLLNGAEYVFTDSFHGVALSINLQKKFFVFERDKKKSSASMNSRIYDVLNMFSLKERLINNCKDIEISSEKEIDYVNVQAILEKKRIISQKFLKNSFKRDLEILRYKQEENSQLFNTPISYYAAQYKKSVLNSSSGGMFASLAEEIINNNGVVYGVGYDSNFNAMYKRITRVEELKELYGSKYICSKFSINASFSTILNDLQKQRRVLFVGTACQIFSLYKYLLKNQQNDELLLTVEVVCHGTPNIKVWESYKGFLQNRFHSKIKDVNFREKKYGWHSYAMCIKFENGKVYRKIMNSDPYMQMYLSGISINKCCLNCEYKGNDRIADITLGDLWGITVEKLNEESKEGLSLVVINSSKGQKIFKDINKKVKFQKLLRGQEIIALSNIMGMPSKVSDIERKEFFNYIENGDFKDAYLYFKKKQKLFYIKNEMKAIIKKVSYHMKK